MKVNSVGQENTSNTLSVLKAGAMGAAAGALVRNMAQTLKYYEEDLYFCCGSDGCCNG